MQGELSENKRNKLTSINKKKCQRLLDTYEKGEDVESSADICYNISYKYMFDKDGVQNSQIDVVGGHYVEGSCSKRYKPGSGI